MCPRVGPIEVTVHDSSTLDQAIVKRWPGGAITACYRCQADDVIGLVGLTAGGQNSGYMVIARDGEGQVVQTVMCGGLTLADAEKSVKNQMVLVSEMRRSTVLQSQLIEKANSLRSDGENWKNTEEPHFAGSFLGHKMRRVLRGNLLD